MKKYVGHIDVSVEKILGKGAIKQARTQKKHLVRLCIHLSLSLSLYVTCIHVYSHTEEAPDTYVFIDLSLCR